ncbi:MAG: DUF202 domain-containing protein [Cyclobacteriaceae bacterium]|nr:DUF202 domain-containing protein [Cyclobacteriaceae bacterium]MCH8516283.1 DUF202 domain-containing protein [Cyclobacteriaceae bacterium]
MNFPRIKKFSFPKLVQDFENKEKIILRDYLALERTSLSNERTLFAYVRLSFYLIIAGIALLEMNRFAQYSWIGFFLFGIALVLLIFGVIRYQVMKKRLSKFYNAIELEKLENKKS